MKNLLECGNIISGKKYVVEMKENETKILRVLTETPTHLILVKEDSDACDVCDYSKQELLGVYEIKDWYETKEA
ncbi:MULTISPECIES: hypothetical protein [Bacillus]|uniref:hypothetical protein n=1 Tax=Bacillus TaxID=1386 RepID=UPI0002E0D91D|nr:MULTISPECIES: hypothetical protein [Bacillus]